MMCASSFWDHQVYIRTALELVSSDHLSSDRWWVERLPPLHSPTTFKDMWNLQVVNLYSLSRGFTTRLIGKVRRGQHYIIIDIVLRTVSSQHMVTGIIYKGVWQQPGDANPVLISIPMLCETYYKVIDLVCGLITDTYIERETTMNYIWNLIVSWKRFEGLNFIPSRSYPFGKCMSVGECSFKTLEWYYGSVILKVESESLFWPISCPVAMALNYLTESQERMMSLLSLSPTLEVLYLTSPALIPRILITQH